MKSELTSDKVWYCGNSFENDVAGASNAGIFPVYYLNGSDDNANADFDYLSIKDWREMIDILGKLR